LICEYDGMARLGLVTEETAWECNTHTHTHTHTHIERAVADNRLRMALQLGG